MVAVLAQVYQRSPGAIRRSVEVDLIISKQPPHIIEIVHRDWRCIQPKVSRRFQRLPAFDECLRREDFVEVALHIVVSARKAARKTMRSSSVALVDENDVAIDALPIIVPVAHSCSGCRSRAADEHE